MKSQQMWYGTVLKCRLKIKINENKKALSPLYHTKIFLIENECKTQRVP